VIATTAHRDAIEERLRAFGLDVAGARACGRYVALDAAATLARVMVNGAPEPGRFGERLEQVLTNLLDNAVKYSPQGGPVEVVLARVGADTVELSVRDRGLGIPAEKREQLFERFYQAHANGNGHRSGMGLGLFVSRQIAQLHGGDIRPEFSLEGGTRFVVRLPIALDETESAGTAAGSVGV
jgi:signal transduction histidine kinase